MKSLLERIKLWRLGVGIVLAVLAWKPQEAKAEAHLPAPPTYTVTVAAAPSNAFSCGVNIILTATITKVSGTGGASTTVVWTKNGATVQTMPYASPAYPFTDTYTITSPTAGDNYVATFTDVTNTVTQVSAPFTVPLALKTTLAALGPATYQQEVCTGGPGTGFMTIPGSQTGATYSITDATGATVYSTAAVAGNNGSINLDLKPSSIAAAGVKTFNLFITAGTCSTFVPLNVTAFTAGDNTQTVVVNSPVCAGTTPSNTIQVLGSHASSIYTVYKGGSALAGVAPQPGSGTATPISFTLPASEFATAGLNTYTIRVVDNGPGCGAVTYTLATPANVFVSAKPVDKVINYAPAYECTGAFAPLPVTIKSADAGIAYAILNSSGVAVVGNIPAATGDLVLNIPLAAFGPAGTASFSVVAYSAACSFVLTTPINISVGPDQNSPVFGSSPVCVGSAPTNSITVQGTASGNVYNVYRGATLVAGPITSTGGTLNITLPPSEFAAAATNTYILKVNTASCPTLLTLTNTATIQVLALPTVDLSGAGLNAAYSPVPANICTSTYTTPASVTPFLTLNKSFIGVNYQLFNGASPITNVVPGTGVAITFTYTTNPFTVAGSLVTLTLHANSSNCSATVGLPTYTVNAPVATSPNPSTLNPNVCWGSAASVAIPAGGIPTNATKQWQRGPTSSGPWANIGTDVFTLNDIPPGSSGTTTYYYQCIVTVPGCGPAAPPATPISVTFTDPIDPTTVAAYTSAAGICLGNSVGFALSPVANPATNLTMVQWQSATNLAFTTGVVNAAPGPIKTLATYTFTPGAQGTYFVRATLTTPCEALSLVTAPLAVVVSSQNPNSTHGGNGGQLYITDAAGTSAIPSLPATEPDGYNGTGAPTCESQLLYFKSDAQETSAGENATWTVTASLSGPLSFNQRTRLLFDYISIDPTGLGGQTVTVVRTYTIGSCGTRTLTVATLILPAPSTSPAALVNTPNVCQGPATPNNILITGSEAGIQYKAFDILGTTPVSNTVVGTGGNIYLSLNAGEFTIPGATNYLIRADNGGGCKTFLAGQPSINVDPAPSIISPSAAVYNLCAGNNSGQISVNTVNGQGYWTLAGNASGATQLFNFTGAPLPVPSSGSPAASSSVFLAVYVGETSPLITATWTATGTVGSCTSNTITKTFTFNISSLGGAPSGNVIASGSLYPDNAFCTGSPVNLQANFFLGGLPFTPPAGTDLWTAQDLVSGGPASGTFSSVNGSTVSFVPGAASAGHNLQFTWNTGTNLKPGCTSSFSYTTTATISPNPNGTITNAAINDACQGVPTELITGTTSLGAVGSWTSSGTGAFSPTATSATVQYIPGPTDGNQTVTLTWTVRQTPDNCNTVTISRTVKVFTAPVAVFGDAILSYNVCLGTKSPDLNAVLPPLGTIDNPQGFWTSTGNGAFTAPNNPHTQYLSASGDEGTAVTVTWNVTNGACTTAATASKTVNVLKPASGTFGIPPLPICVGNSTPPLGATAAPWSQGTWSTTLGAGTFSNIHDPAATYTSVAADTNQATIDLIWTLDNSTASCDPLTLKQNLRVAPPALSSFTAPGTICVGNTTSVLNGSLTLGETGMWSTPDGGGSFVPSQNAPAAQYKSVAADGGRTIHLTWAVDNHICSTPALATQSFLVDAVNIVVGPDTAVCNDAVNVKLHAKGGLTYFWSTLSGNPGLDNANIATPTIVSPNTNSTTTYVVTVNDGLCSDTKQQMVTYKADGSVTADASAPAVCSGTTVTLLGAVTNINAGSYHWEADQPGVIFSDPTSLNPTVRVTNTTVFTLKGTTATLGCLLKASTTVTTYPVIAPVIITSDNCNTSGTDHLQVLNTGNVSACTQGKLWFNAAATTVLAAGPATRSNPYFVHEGETLQGIGDKDGTYTYTFSCITATSCITTAQATYTIYPKIVANFTADNTNLVFYQPTVNFTDSSVSNLPLVYLWDFGDSGSPDNTSTEQNPKHTYSGTGTYPVTLYVNNAIGCNDLIIKSNYIHIKSPDFAFPTAFSPNGDIYDQTFYPLPGKQQSITTSARITIFQVFDRNGLLVFDNPALGSWDGSLSDGSPAEVGTYSYKVEIVLPEVGPKTYSGLITLLR